MLPEIIISCDIPGLVHIGDTLLGEVDKEAFQSFIGAGSFYLKYTPLSLGKIYSPLCVKISIENGSPIFECPYISLFNYKDNTYLLEITPQCLAVHTLPVCHSYKKAEDRFTISLIEQNSFYIVIEDDKKLLPDSFFPLLFDTTPLMDVVLINEVSVILLGDRTNRVYAFTCGENGFTKTLCLDADEYSYYDEHIIIKKTTSAGHIITNSYGIRNGNLHLVDTHATVNTVPADNIVVDFLECVKYGIKEKALSCLSPDLQLSFEELKEFLGEFSRFKSSPFESNAYALIADSGSNSHLVNRFSFEIIGNKINNIQEL